MLFLKIALSPYRMETFCLPPSSGCIVVASRGSKRKQTVRREERVSLPFLNGLTFALPFHQPLLFNRVLFAVVFLLNVAKALAPHIFYFALNRMYPLAWAFCPCRSLWLCFAFSLCWNQFWTLFQQLVERKFDIRGTM